MKTYSKNKVTILRKREAEPWIYSYADLVTNLLAFFMMMLIIISANKTKKEELIKGIEDYVKGRSFIPSDIGNTGTEQKVPDIAEMKQVIQDYIKDNALTDQVSLSAMRDGIELTFEGALVFDSGTAVITQQAELILSHIASLLKKLPPKYSLDVEGHADARPIESFKFPSNWELSSARAGSVVRFLEASGMTGTRMRAIGYSSTHPVDENGLAAENRRVVVKVTGRGEFSR